MFFEEPKVEFVRLDVSNSVIFTSGNCIEDQNSGQGGGSCIGNQDHSTGENCYDTAPLTA